jgi:hypothetical protein
MKPGQTLIILLVFMMVGITVITTSVMLSVTASLASGNQVNSWQAYDIAESGVEDSLMILLRNPFYTASGQTLTVGNGIATITVTDSGTGNLITSVGAVGNFRRTLQVTTDTTGGRLTVQSWREIYP